MKLQPYYIIILLVISLAACKSSKQITSTVKKNAVEFIQDGKAFQVKNESINLKNAPFSIQFLLNEYDPDHNKLYACQIAALESMEDLDQINLGMKTNETVCFQHGSGMAASRNGYAELIITNDGHHYLSYKEGEVNRVNKVDKINDLFLVEFKVPVLFINGETIQFEEYKNGELYLAILIDANLNQIIEEGELTKVVVRMN